MDFYNCAVSIIEGAGGYENIISIDHINSGIAIKVKNNKKIRCKVFEKNKMIKKIISVSYAEDVGEHMITLHLVFGPKNAPQVYNELCVLYKDYETMKEDTESGKKTEDRDDCGPDAENKTQTKRRYTAEYFINIAEEAVKNLPLQYMEKSTVLGFVFMIAEEAARFANEKGLEDEFVFVPEFAEDLVNVKNENGRMEAGGNIFISADKSACISVRYQKDGNEEVYNLLVTDIEEKNRISYAGAINSHADRDAVPDAAEHDKPKEEPEADTKKPAEILLHLMLAIQFAIVIILLIVSPIMNDDHAVADHNSGKESVQQSSYRQEETGSKKENESEAAEEKTPEELQSEPAREAVLNLMSFVIVMIKGLGILMTVIGAIRISFAVCTEDEIEKSKSASLIAMGIALLITTMIIPNIVASLAVVP